MSRQTDNFTEHDPTTDQATDTEKAPPESSASPSDASPPPRRKWSKKWIFMAASVVLFLTILVLCNLDKLSGVFSMFGTVLSPIILGAVIAYLCNPIMRFFEYGVFRKMKKGVLHSSLSLILTVLVVILILAGVVALIVPELILSIEQLATNLTTTYIPALRRFLDDLLANLNQKMPDQIDLPSTDEVLVYLGLNDIQSILNNVLKYFQNLDINIGGSIWQVLSGLFNAVKNVILGIFIAIYILSSKEKRSAQIRKARAALLNEQQDRKLMEVVRLADKTFGGYAKGLLVDALFVGLLTYVLLTIFQVSDYNLLIAAICGVTNVIPVFGPFIGAIPSAFIVLISNPSKFIIFIILILIIQQIDGNIIVPRVQGSTTGISALSVLIAITVMGKLFGIPGMILGVPIFAVVIELVKRELERRLRRRGLPTDTVDYYPTDAVGNAEEEVYYERAHLRYKYDNSKMKKRIDRIRARFARKKKAKATAKAQAKADNASDEPSAEAPRSSRTNGKKKKKKKNK